MPEYLLDTYAGTKAEVEYKNVLARGGVVGGISAGALILAGDTVNGSLSADRQWVMRKGFGLLRGRVPYGESIRRLAHEAVRLVGVAPAFVGRSLWMWAQRASHRRARGAHA